MSAKKIFISYSSKDKFFVDQLADDLKTYDIDVWEYSTRVLAGEQIERKISQAIKDADYYLVVLSPNSVKSEWVNSELTKAIGIENNKAKKKFVIPVLFEDCELPNLISDKQYVNFVADYQTGLQQL